MNSWPTLKEWMQFGGIVALEVIIVFAIAKLVTLRVRSAQWRRALWQMALLAMFIAVIGELSGVRGFMRWPETTVAQPQRKLVVTLKEPDAAFPLPPIVLPTTQAPVHLPARWQQPTTWPVWAWLAGTVLVLCRGLLAQITALAFRFSCRRIDDAELIERMERARSVFRIRRRVRLLESARAVAPFTFGIWKPVIVLPRGFTETFTADQQEVALAHELAHVAGFDSAWRSAGDFICALLWWHPFAWQTKRELSQASEFVADESSLLIADGPNRLAECLVACAKELRPPALTTWLGMDGGGFRSGLGRRVARLMQLRSNDSIVRRVPWYARLVVPVLTTALLWVGMMTIVKPSQSRVSAWRTSILGSAFAAAAENNPSAIASEDVKTKTARMVQDGKLYYETDRLKEAEETLRTVLKLDPNHKGAAYFLDLVLAKKAAAATRLPENESKDSSATKPPVTSKARQEIFMKLRNTRLNEWGPIDNLPLSEVIRSLAEEMRRRSPDQKGVNFMLSGNRIPKPGDEVDASGLPKEVAPRVDINASTVRLGSMLRDVTIEDILNVLTAITERPIQYSIEDFGVIISPKSKVPQPLHTRFFHVDPNTFQQGLDSMFLAPASPTRDGPRSGRLSRTNSFMTEVVPGEIIVPKLQKWLRTLGVDLTEPGKAFFFNDRIGVVMVRATLAELETVEKAMQLLNMSPPQLTIRVKFFEVERDKNGSALDYFLGTLITNEAISTPLVQQPTTRPRSGSAVSDAIPNELLTAGVRTQMPKTPIPAPTITGILTDEQFRKMVSALERRGITDMLSAPEVTTMSGRQAQIKVVNVQYVVTDLDYTTNISSAKTSAGGAITAGETNSVITPIAEPFEIGPVLDVVPYVMPDGMTIQMTVMPTVREFLGYDDPGDFAMEVRTGDTKSTNILKSPMPLPRFRLRQVATTAKVWDGQTLMLSAGTSRQEVRTRDANGKVTVTFKDKELFYFITPRLIDPAGNPIHDESELRKIQKEIPPQRANGSQGNR